MYIHIALFVLNTGCVVMYLHLYVIPLYLPVPIANWCDEVVKIFTN